MDKLKHGFSTVELLIALAILSLTLSAVIIISFGNQLFLTGSIVNTEATGYAEYALQNIQSLAQKDFNLVNPITEKKDIYTISVSAKLLSDFLSKHISATVSWQDERNIAQSYTLNTLVTNYENPYGMDTCDSTLTGNWQMPYIENTVTDFSALVGNIGAQYTLSDIDVYKGLAYITASEVGTTTDPTFFIFDTEKIITDPYRALIFKTDNEISAGTVRAGLNAVKVTEDPANPTKKYTYAVNAYNANYTTCDPITRKNCGQLYVFDVTHPAATSLLSNLKLTSNPPIAGSTTGNSIFYRNGYLAIGLTSTNGPEFHLIDVGNTSTLFNSSKTLTPISSYEIGHDINAIEIRGVHAYIAVPGDTTAQELRTLNLSQPTLPTLVGGYNLTNIGNGKSIYMLGDEIYFGNTVPHAGNDVHILDNTDPETSLPVKAGFNSPSSINAIRVRDYLTYTLTNDSLHIYHTVDRSNISAWATVPLPSHAVSPIPEPSMDCEGNKIFIISNDPLEHGALYIITAS